MELVAEIRRCRECLDTLTPNPIVQLDRDARILIAGQAPGRVAHEAGIPFLDASGRRLRDWMGITETDFNDAHNVAILPMAFCYPGKGSQGDLPPPGVCADRWRDRALAALARVELTLLIGGYAQAWHLGVQHQSVTDTVSGWREHLPGVVPLPHPSPRNTAWLRRNPWFEASLVPALQARVQEILYK